MQTNPCVEEHGKGGGRKTHQSRKHKGWTINRRRTAQARKGTAEGELPHVSMPQDELGRAWTGARWNRAETAKVRCNCCFEMRTVYRLSTLGRYRLENLRRSHNV